MDLSSQLQGSETAEQVGRNIAHAYERLHLQRPSLSHNELLRKILAERKENMSRVSPNAVARIIGLHESLPAQANVTLGELAFQVTLAVSEASEASLGWETASMLRKVLDAEITKTLGYIPDSSEMASLKRKQRDAALQTKQEYQRYLESTSGVGKPLGNPEVPWENQVLQTRQEWQNAADQVARLGLPAHFQPEKNWDSLAALTCILRRTDKTATILDAGAELYSVLLPCLFLYGYQNLIGINLLFDQPTELGGIRYQPGDITKTAFPEGTFDAIACLSVVEHGVNLQAYFQEASRILKIGGVLITSTDYYASSIDTKSAIAYGAPIHIFTKEEIISALDMASQFGLELTTPINLESRDKAVRWEEFDLDYTFITITLEKKRISKPREALNGRS